MVQPLYCSAAESSVWGERGYGGGSTPYVWLSSIALLPWLLGFPPQAFPTTFSSLTTLPSVSPHSTEALALELIHIPQTLASCHCTFQGTCIPVRDMYGCSKDCLILIPFRLPQISCFPLSLKCFSSDSDSCPKVRIGSLPQFPHLPRAGPVLLTLLLYPLLPSSCRALCGSIYSFPLVRFSYLLAAGVLHALLGLKVYSRCIWGERGTPRSRTICHLVLYVKYIFYHNRQHIRDLNFKM